ncbi:hypothetical protein BHE74_00001023 [Ensete ventricosum]|nr:hypothetical protein BHE74_00001023 [Ensete ventricosum]
MGGGLDDDDKMTVCVWGSELAGGGLTEALVDPRRCIPIKHSHRTHRSRTRATYLPCIRGWGWAHTNQEADVVLKPFKDKHMTSPAGPHGPGGFSREGLGTFWGPNSKRIKWGSINGGRRFNMRIQSDSEKNYVKGILDNTPFDLALWGEEHVRNINGVLQMAPLELLWRPTTSTCKHTSANAQTAGTHTTKVRHRTKGRGGRVHAPDIQVLVAGVHQASAGVHVDGHCCFRAESKEDEHRIEGEKERERERERGRGRMVPRTSRLMPSERRGEEERRCADDGMLSGFVRIYRHAFAGTGAFGFVKNLACVDMGLKI